MKKIFLIMILLVMSGCAVYPPYVNLGVAIPGPVYRGYYNYPHPYHYGHDHYNRGWGHRGWHGR